MDNIILLTATINANRDNFTKIIDHQIRLNHYLKALNFYLKNTSVKIIFAENSGFDILNHLDFSINSYRERLEIMSFNGNSYDINFGKGYGELGILKYAIANSQILKEQKNVFLTKLTGRLILKNINAHLNRINKVESSKTIMADMRKNLSFTDSRFFISDINFFLNHLFKFGSMLNDSKGVFFEHILSKAILDALLSSEYSFLPLNYHLNFKGYSASLNQKYDESFFKALYRDYKYKIKRKNFEY